MDDLEKAIYVLNRRITHLGHAVRDAKSDESRKLIFKALVVTKTVGDSLHDYVQAVEKISKDSVAEFQVAHESMMGEQEKLLQLAKKLKEEISRNPADEFKKLQLANLGVLSKSIDSTYQTVVKTYQLHLDICIGMVDKFAQAVGIFCESELRETLKGLLKKVAANLAGAVDAVAALTETHDIFEAASWDRNVIAEIDSAVDFYDAYSRTGFHLALTMELMKSSSKIPSDSTEPVSWENASDAVTARFEEVMKHFLASDDKVR